MAYSKKRLIAAAMAGVLAMMSAFPGYPAVRFPFAGYSWPW